MRNKPLTFKNLIEIDMDTTTIIADAFGYSILKDDVDTALLLQHAGITYDLSERDEALEEIKAISEVEFDQRKTEVDEQVAEMEIRNYFDAIGAGLPSFPFRFEYRYRYCDQLCHALEAEWETEELNKL